METLGGIAHEVVTMVTRLFSHPCITLGQSGAQGKQLLRSRVTQDLGLGMCTGKQLIRAVQLFGITWLELDDAIARSRQQLGEAP